MSKGIEKTGCTNVSSFEYGEGWRELGNNPEEMLEGAALLEFENILEDNPDIDQDEYEVEDSCISLDFQTEEFTYDGYVKIRGNVSYDMHGGEDTMEVETSITVYHGGLELSEIGKISDKINSMAVEALENYTNRKECL